MIYLSLTELIGRTPLLEVKGFKGQRAKVITGIAAALAVIAIGVFVTGRVAESQIKTAMAGAPGVLPDATGHFDAIKLKHFHWGCILKRKALFSELRAS